MGCVSKVTLIDKDIYEAGNIGSQDITHREIGKAKAVVQSRRLKRINPSLSIESIPDAVERVPLGKLRSDVILSCLDSRVARQHINQFAWRLGVPLVDAGVEPGGLLARVNVYLPGFDDPCLECAWDDRDYQALEQTYPCQERSAGVAATNAPSSLGALAASLQAIECHKLLVGQTDRAAIGQQVLIDALHHRHYLTKFRRNPDCRFDHQVWRIEPASASLTLQKAIELGRERTGSNASKGLKVEGKPFVTRLVCQGCGNAQALLRLECSLNMQEKTCSKCGERLAAAGFDLLERLNAACVPADALGDSLRKLGLRTGEVFSIDSQCHYEIARHTGVP
jgi:molybdopterin/thiamine biosynthesis adenylyltransferase